jgi:hypothetical protein
VKTDWVCFSWGAKTTKVNYVTDRFAWIS